jgi:membrane associated rhomboid family serine protease
MFPIGDENRNARGVAVMVLVLVALNVLVFVYEMSLTVPQLKEFITTYGAIPAEIEQGDDLYTLITSMFVHGGLAHIAGNMLFLFIFGDNIERRFGSVTFVLFYVACGLAASAAHLATNADSPTPTVGASGAISGVMGAYILLYPLNRVRVLVGYWWVIPVPAFIFLGIWFLTQLMYGTMALNVETAQSAGVAFWAHVGGFAAGVVLAIILAPFRKEPVRNNPEFAIWRDR